MRDFINIVANQSTQLSEDELSEAPIEDINLLGNWDKNSSFRDPRDRKLLTNPKAITKIKGMWKYPEEVGYNILLINNSEANRHTEVGDVGPAGGTTDEHELLRMFPNTWAEIKPYIRSDQINIIFTNNKGAERVPMTGWIMAHRLGHVMYRKNRGQKNNVTHFFDEATREFNRIISDVMKQYNMAPAGYRSEPLMSTNSLPLISAVCSFKAARENNLRNPFEAIFDLFAQYIFLGKIKFNDIPTSIKWKRATYTYNGNADYDYDNRSIKDDLAGELQDFFETALHYAVGRIYVM